MRGGRTRESRLRRRYRAAIHVSRAPIRLENGVHHIEPWSEDGDFNYKFHLLVAIDNDGSTDASG